MQYIYIYIQQVFAGIALNHLLSWYRHAVCSLSLHVLKQDPPPSPPCKSFDARIPEYHSIVVYKQLYLLKRLSLSLFLLWIEEKMDFYLDVKLNNSLWKSISLKQIYHICLIATFWTELENRWIIYVKYYFSSVNFRDR